MKNLLVCVLLLVAAPQPCFAQDSESPVAAPEWFIQEIAALTAGSGRWIADNSAYKSEQEPFEAYVTEWSASFDGTTMSGRLFGIKDGSEVPDADTHVTESFDIEDGIWQPRRTYTWHRAMAVEK